MSRSRTLLALTLLLLLPLAAAQAGGPPAEAAMGGQTLLQLAHWAGPDERTVDHQAEPGENGTLWFAARISPSVLTDGRNYTASVNLTAADYAFDNASLSLPVASGWSLASTPFRLSANATAGAQYNYTVEVRDDNGTMIETFSAAGPLVVQGRVEPPAPPVGIPTSYLVGGGAAVVVGGAAALYALRQRRERRIMNQAPRRSQVMREMELERQLEKVEEKEPERAAEIKEEIRAQEVVREKRRELQILEAKRADALKTMDLLRKRHETGGLTKLQYDNMVAKKQADLQRIEADIAQMEAEDAAGGAAA